MPLFCQPGSAEHLSIWLKGPLEGCSTVAASLSGTELPWAPPAPILVPSLQRWCPRSPRTAWSPSSSSPMIHPVSAISCQSGAPWGTFVPVEEENQNLLNCVCSRCLVGDCRSGPGDWCWGWVRAIPQGCTPYTGTAQKLRCGRDARGTLWPVTQGAGAPREPFPAPVYLSSSNSAPGVLGLFPNQFIYCVNYNFQICCCVPPEPGCWGKKMQATPRICPPQPAGTAS